MDYSYCPNCGKKTGHKRALGWGTLFGALFTFGISLFLIPFYPKRCIACGREWSDETFETRELKKCPYCAELIKREAIRCRYCSAEMPLEIVAQEMGETSQTGDPVKGKLQWFGFGMFVLVILLFAFLLLIFAKLESN